MTSLKSIMERRTMQVLDVRDMKNLKGGANTGSNNSDGGGLPPPTPPDGSDG
ncbi:MAG: hypothetical protein AB8F94_14665 [Saprospiraceae bacterium]